MFESEIDEWQQRVDSFPQLKSEQSEYIHTVQSGFIDGVTFADERNYDARVVMVRLANDEPGYPPVIHYTLEIFLGATHPTMLLTPEAAIDMGRSLMLAGTAALRDKSENLGFLAGPEVFL